LQEAARLIESQGFRHINVLTDSQYVANNYKNAMFLWPKTRWLRKGGAPVLNAELWKDLVRQMKRTGLFVEIHKVPGHSSDLHNRAVDKLAKRSAQMPLNKPVSVRIIRRKKSKETTKVGSVSMRGQRITIRIIEGQFLRPQRVYRYRYEVVAKRNRDYGKVDFICCDEALHETSSYIVKVNDEPMNPRIEKIFRVVG
jgi:ribonuclease HI